MTTKHRCSIVLILLALARADSPAADWPMLGRDDSRNAVSPETNAPADWDVETGRNIKWSAKLGTACVAEPVIAGGLVWIGTNNSRGPRADSRTDAAALLCFRESDGELLYEYVSPRLKTGRNDDWPYSPIGCAPLIEGDRMWFTTNRCETVCMDVGPLRRGAGPPSIVWKFDMKELGVDPVGQIMFLNRSCSIASYSDWIYVVTNNGADQAGINTPAPQAPGLICFDKLTGKVVWVDSSPGANILRSQCASPLAIEIAGKTQVIVPQGDGWIRSFTPDGNGEGGSKLIWKFDMNFKTSKWLLGRGGDRNNVLATPVYDNGRVYIASGQEPEHGEGSGRLVCLDPTKTGDISSELAVDRSGDPLPHRRRQAVDESKGERAVPNPNSGLVWEFTVLGDDFEQQMHRSISQVAVADDLLIACDGAGLVHCLDARTGRRHWHYDMFASIWSSPLIVDGKVYATDQDGDVAIFRLSADPTVAMRQGEEPLAEINMGRSVYASPVFANGVLYLATPSRLFAVADPEAELSRDSAQAARQSSAGWPQFFGPDRSNRSSEVGLLDAWPDRGPRLVWRAEGLGNGFAPPAIAAGRIYTTGNRNDNDQLICLDEQTGAEQWSVTLRAGVAEYRRMRWLNQRTPTFDGDRVYAVSEYGDLVCVDATSGRERWRRDYETDFSGGRPVYGYCDYPLVDGDKLICTPNGSDTTHVALDKLTGDVIWKGSVQLNRPSSRVTGYSACLASNGGGVRQYVQLFGGTLIGIGAETGRLLWRYEDDFANPAANAYVPIVRDDFIFCANCYGKGCVLLKITPNGEGLTPQVVYRREYGFQYQHSCTVLVRDHVYAGLEGGTLACLNFETGEIVWQRKQAIQQNAAAHTFADGNLYLRHRGGLMTLVQADPSRYVERGRFALPLPQPEPHYTYPVVANGRLLVRHDDVLLCYDVRQTHGNGGDDAETYASGNARKTPHTAGHWPQWRGPRRDNVSDEMGLLQEWPKGGPPLVWKAEGIGTGISCLAVASGRIVTVGYQGESEYAIALDEQTGALEWATRIGPAVEESRLMRWLAQRAPTIDETHVYAVTYLGELVCLDLANGKELWRKRYIEDFGARKHAWGMADYPLVDGDKLICAPCGSEAALVALDKATGDISWKLVLPEVRRRGYAAIVATEAAGVGQYVTFLGDSIVGVASQDGELLWRYEPIANRTGNSHTPIVIDDYVLCSSGYGRGIALLRLVPNSGGIEVEKVYHSRQMVDTFADPTIRVGARAYTCQSGRILACFDWKTGDILWRDRIDARRLSSTFADGRLYLYSSDGAVLLVEDSGDAPRERGRFELPDYERSIGATSPVVARGRLYLRDDNRLFCYDVREQTLHEPRGEPREVAIVIPPPEAPSAKETTRPGRTPKPIFVPTPEDVVEKMLALADVTAQDTLVDLGSGDGRIVIAAARKGAQAIGYEIDEELVALAREKLKEANVEQAEIRRQDMYTADLSEASVVAVYLYPVVLEKLKPQFAKMKPGSRIVSHYFDIPGVRPDRVIEVESGETGNRHRVLFYTTPLAVRCPSASSTQDFGMVGFKDL